MSEHVTNDDEPYLLVEEIAERFGLPLAVLLRRVEAGDVPSRRVDRDDGQHYALRLSDLGIDTDDDDEPDGINVFDDGGPARGVGGSPAPAIEDATPPPPAAEWLDIADVAAWLREADDTGVADRVAASSAEAREPAQPEPGAAWAVEHADPESGWQTPGEEPDHNATATESGHDGGSQPELEAEAEPERVPAPAPPWQVREPATPAWFTRPVEPQAEPAAVDAAPHPVSATADEPVEEPAEEGAPELEEPAVVATPDVPAAAVPVAEEPAATAAAPPELETQHERRRDPSRGLFDAAAGGPRGDLAAMSLDARDLVAGLLDRWERTLEQRIYTEQRQRFQGELTARQNMVKQLQMELQTARAEHAAAQAEKDRLLAEKERELAERERQLADARHRFDDTDTADQPASPTPPSSRRRWFRTRDDA
jgi:hypothetical protein